MHVFVHNSTNFQCGVLFNPHVFVLMATEELVMRFLDQSNFLEEVMQSASLS